MALGAAHHGLELARGSLQAAASSKVTQGGYTYWVLINRKENWRVAFVLERYPFDAIYAAVSYLLIRVVLYLMMRPAKRIDCHNLFLAAERNAVSSPLSNFVP